MLAVTITAIQTSGPIVVTYTGSRSGAGNQAIWPDLASLQNSLNTELVHLLSENGLLRLFLKWYLVLSPNPAGNISFLVNHTITVDYTKVSNPVSYV